MLTKKGANGRPFLVSHLGGGIKYIIVEYYV